MKLRHTAALALAVLPACTAGMVRPPRSTGWEILQPPQLEGRPEGYVDENASLSKWVVAPWEVDSYPTQDQCERILENSQNGSRREGFPQFFGPIIKSRCVSI